MKDRRTTKPKKKYSKISTQKRLKLVQMVLEEGLTLTKVAKSLHIKRPTAKVILKRYKQKGTFFHKKMAQIKTRESIGSNSQPKIEEKSRENVSIELQPDEDNRPLPEGSALPVRTEQQQADEPIRLLYFYSLFPQYPSFMSQHPHLKLATHTRSQPSFQATPAFVKLTNSHRYALNLEYRKLIMVARHAQTGALLFANTLWMIL